MTTGTHPTAAADRTDPFDVEMVMLHAAIDARLHRIIRHERLRHMARQVTVIGVPAAALLSLIALP